MSPYRIVSPFTRRRIGRRGAFLLILSLAMADLGWSILDVPPVTVHALHVFGHMTPLELGLTWLIPAAVAFLAAWSGPGFMDGPAFLLCELSWFLWGAAYVLSWEPFHDLTAEQALRPTGFYWCVAGLVLVAAGWPESILLAVRSHLKEVDGGEQ